MNRYLCCLLLSVFAVQCSGSPESSGTETAGDGETTLDSTSAMPADPARTEGTGAAAISDIENASYGLTEPAAADPDVNAQASVCSEFLDEYTAWSDRFLEAAAGMLEHPNEPSYQDNYRRVASKVSEWNARWEELQDCPQHPDFRQQFETVGRKMELEMAKLQAE